ncbi:Rha family transcriptional regulator [Pyramidobacter sp.]|uniref:Rha family transcriptional regulator n=1 Tax=Pyramidobacter sp. TaxID=1943581 RepID=UPI003325D087
MNDLIDNLGITELDGEAAVSSLSVARTFGKEHKNVIRDVRELDCSPEFSRLNFKLAERKDAQDKPRPYYMMTRDGFTFLTMGYTGKKAARLKEAYIEAFNAAKIPYAKNESSSSQDDRTITSDVENSLSPKNPHILTLSFQDHTVRALLRNDDLWWVARDVLAILGLNPKHGAENLDDDEKEVAIIDTPRGKKRMTIINEFGLWNLIMRGRKPEAKAFGQWLTREVLPSALPDNDNRQTITRANTERETLAALTADLGVTERDGRAVVSSLDLAKKFEKEHRSIIRSIKNLDPHEDFTEHNFVPSEYQDITGRKLPCYLISRDGFMLLIMGFTGKKAEAIKVAYIRAFNAMEAALRERERSGMPPAALRELAAAATQITAAVTELARLTAELAGVTAAVARRQDDVERRCAALERRLAPRPARPTPENQLNLFMRPHDLLDEARRDLHQPREEREPVRTSSYTTIGPRLRELRKEHYNMSPDEFAELTGVTATTLMAIEAGISRPGLGTLSRLRLRTGVSADWLLFGEGPVHPVSKDYTIAPFTGA